MKLLFSLEGTDPDPDCVQHSLRANQIRIVLLLTTVVCFQYAHVISLKVHCPDRWLLNFISRESNNDALVDGRPSVDLGL